MPVLNKYHSPAPSGRRASVYGSGWRFIFLSLFSLSYSLFYLYSFLSLFPLPVHTHSHTDTQYIYTNTHLTHIHMHAHKLTLTLTCAHTYMHTSPAGHVLSLGRGDALGGAPWADPLHCPWWGVSCSSNSLSHLPASRGQEPGTQRTSRDPAGPPRRMGSFPCSSES